MDISTKSGNMKNKLINMILAYSRQAIRMRWNFTLYEDKLMDVYKLFMKVFVTQTSILCEAETINVEKEYI